MLRLRDYQVKTHFGINLRVQGELIIEPGQMIEVKAASGFGKSSFVNGLLGFCVEQGDLQLNGRSLISCPSSRRKISTVFQDDRLVMDRTVIENLKIVMKTSRHPFWDEGVKRLQLEGLLKQYVGSLSGGELSRVSLFRAFLSDYEAMIWDEPFRGLDATLQEDVFSFVESCFKARPIPVLWIHHHDLGVRAFLHRLHPHCLIGSSMDQEKGWDGNENDKRRERTFSIEPRNLDHRRTSPN